MNSKILAYHQLLVQKNNFSVFLIFLVLCGNTCQESYAGFFPAEHWNTLLESEGTGGGPDFNLTFHNNEVGFPSKCEGLAGGRLYLEHENKIILCYLNNSSSNSFKPFPGVRVHNVDILASSLDGEDIGEVLSKLGLDTAAIHTLNISDSEIFGSSLGSEYLSNLKILDLRGNGLSILNQPSIDSLQKIYLSDNGWNCVQPGTGVGKWSISSLDFGWNMSWLLEKKYQDIWVDRNLTKCRSSNSRRVRWYDLEDANNLIIDFIQFTKKTLSACPPGCDCELAQPLADVEDSPSHQIQYRVSVLCSYLKLQDLPPIIPDKTCYLDASNNNITSLFGLRGLNSAYKYLTKLNVANNTIQSMEGLRDSWILQNSPTELDLTLNQMALFDTTILEPIMNQHSTKMTKVEYGLNFLFSDNPWQCGCDRIQHIQEFLAKYHFLLKDADSMMCSGSVSILDFNYKEECKKETIDFWGLLVVVEILMLLGVVGKLWYDCIVYRQTGHLPWVARHLCGKNVLCLPGISRFSWKRWFGPLPGASWSRGAWLPSRVGADAPPGGLGGKRGSSGYMTGSGASSHAAVIIQQEHLNHLLPPESTIEFV